MILDCHVHAAALLPGRGRLSPRLLASPTFRFLRWRLGLVGDDAAVDAGIESALLASLDAAPEIDRAVVLAFDAVYREDGSRDEANTHLFVENDTVADLARRRPKVLYGCSVHPYRKDAVAELARCAKAGAVLCKWLPITQGFDPAHRLCEPFYEALAHLKMPLLSHTGGEKSLPNLNPEVADPSLLLPALRRGVTVIAAHCGTRSVPNEPCFVSTFVRMAREHAQFYGDTSALLLPTRWYAWPRLLEDGAVRAKLVHGSDWPILPLPPPRIGLGAVIEAMREPNWIRRDVLIKRRLGLDDAYWRRAGEVIGA